MDIILITLLVLLVGIVSTILYLNLRSKPKDDNGSKEVEEIANLKTEIHNLKDYCERLKDQNTELRERNYQLKLENQQFLL